MSWPESCAAKPKMRREDTLELDTASLMWSNMREKWVLLWYLEPSISSCLPARVFSSQQQTQQLQLQLQQQQDQRCGTLYL